MKNHKENNHSAFPLSPFIALVAVLSLGLPACYEPIEGCLDANAVNFSLDADRECDACCQYPGLSIRLVHRWEDSDTSFSFRYTSDAFRDANGHPFSIDRITYYLHEFSLIDAAGTQLFTVDTVLVAQLNSGGFYEDAFILDDYLLVNPAVSSALDVGTLPRNGNFIQLRFALGIDALTDRIQPVSLPTNHPLSLLDTTMYELANNRYFSNRLDLLRDTSASADTLLLTYGAERASIPVTVDIPGGFALPAGFSVEVAVQVNYAEWFAGVGDIENAAPETILDQIVAGLPNAFSLLEITVNQR